ncbi:MAG: prepilin peptidase, partial [Acidimicrobiales bacterium]
MLNQMAALVLITALGGLAVGSFLNVVIYRVPRHASVVHPRSACTSCGAGIRPFDNVPVASWLILKGHCRHCHAGISARYPAVESLTALLFVGIALRFGWSWTLPAELVLVAGLVALAGCDLDNYLLPKRIVYPTLLGVAVAALVAAGATGRWE